MPAPDAIQLHLEDGATMLPHLEDGATMLPHLEDGATMLPHLEDAGPQDLVRGAIMVVVGRVPMISTTGLPPVPNASPWGLGGGTVSPVIVDFGAELRDPEPAHYAPGPLRPQDVNGYTKDTIRVTDALGVHRDLFVWFRPDHAPQDQALEVPIGSDGVAGLYAGGKLVLTATGGVGPYVWDFAFNRSGATLTPEGVYVAGPAIGIDRLRVTDSLGEIGLVQAEVLAGLLGADMVVDPDPQIDLYRHSAVGVTCQPYAKVWGTGGTAPYSVAMQDNQTGAVIEPEKGRRVAFFMREMVDAGGAELDLTGWSFDARLYGQRGGVLASGLAVTVTGNVVEVEIPEPGELLFTPAVLRLEAETAGSVLALGRPTLAIETMLIAQEA